MQTAAPAAAPYDQAQPDALAFLDQPIGEFGTFAAPAAPPCQDLGANSADFYSSAQLLQPPAWGQTPGAEVRLAAGHLVLNRVSHLLMDGDG
jgi:hypothetical protein